MPTPSPHPIDVIVHSAPAADWQVWAAFAPLLAAIVAALIAAATLWQRRRADNRAEWWRRAQWALDASISDQRTRAEMGQKAIELLGQSRLARPEDAVLLKIGTEDPLGAAERALRAEAHEDPGMAHSVSAEATTMDVPPRPRDNGTEIRNDGDG